MMGTVCPNGVSKEIVGRRSPPFNCRESLAALIAGTVACEFVVDRGHPGIQPPQLVVQRRKGHPSEGREGVGRIFEESGESTP